MVSNFQSVVKCLLLLVGVIIVCAQTTQKIETVYDKRKDLTTIRLAPINLVRDNERYHSLDFALSSQYANHAKVIPKSINLELTSVVKARQLDSDLYVVFVVDDKPVHFSSNRSAIHNPVPGHPWIGERMEFIVPYGDFERLVNARSLSIKLGNTTFEFTDNARQALRTFLAAVQE